MTEKKKRAEKLQVKPGTKLWVWPEREMPELGDEHTLTDVADAEVGLIFADVRAEVDEAMQQYADDLAGARAVWIVYLKGNKTDMNRDTLWVQLAEYGWKAVSQVSYCDQLSALRVRPFKKGEAPS